MDTQALSIRESLPTVSGAEIERHLQIGDLSKMSDSDRARFYLSVCASVGLNALTRPFTLMKNRAGELFLHASKLCCEQLRKRDRVSVNIMSRERDPDFYTVVAKARTPDGREEESIGITAIKGLQGQALANAFMACETRAKNRVTMAICGLGFATEEDAAPGSTTIRFNPHTGEIAEPHPPARVVSLIPPADISPSGADAVRENINALLSSHGMSLEDALAWWDKMTTKYGSTLTPAILTMLYDQLKAKADALATVEVEPVEDEEEEIV